MTSVELSQLLGEYERKFGTEAARLFLVPNYLANRQLGPALVDALRTGQPITQAGAEALLGPPCREAVL